MPSFPKPKRRTAAERLAARRRGGWRTARKRTKFGTPTRAAEKAAARRAEVAVIAAVRRAVWARSGGRCELCGDTEADTATKSHKRTHELHEVRKRSATRGLSPEQRFSTAWCLRVCQPCHSQLERHQVTIHLPTPDGLDGPGWYATRNTKEKSET